MAGRFVRASKYRHVFGRPTRKESCYDNLRISKNAHDSNLIKANPLYLAVNWEASGGGAFAVIPLSEKGKLPEQFPLFRGHTAPVLDTDWSPFNDSLIASASDDGKVFLWTVPKDFTLLSDDDSDPQDIAPVSRLSGHGRKVGHVLFNPSAENIFASSSGDFTVKIWDAATGQSPLTLKHPDIIQSLTWSGNGGLLVTTCRDKKLRIWDTRQQKTAFEVPGHAGAKNSRAVWMGEVDRIATTGFSRMSERQLGLWDVRKPEEPIGGFQSLDSISGVCMPFWDDGTKCLYLAGKGDGNIRYFEYDNDDLVLLSEYRSGDPQRGIAFVPKRGVAVHENEVMRAYKTVNDQYIEPISFIVPRRAETFQSDIFPEAPNGQRAMTSDQWLGGKDGFAPKFDLAPLYTEDGTANPVIVGGASSFSPTATSSAPAAAPQARSLPASVASPSPRKENIPASMPREEPSPIKAAAEPPITKPTPVEPVPTFAKPPSPVKSTFSPPPPAQISTSSAAAAPPSPNNPRALSPIPSSEMNLKLEHLSDLLNRQNSLIAQQSETIVHLRAEIAEVKGQGDEIGRMKADIAKLQDGGKAGGSGEKDKRIRELELQLEELRGED